MEDFGKIRKSDLAKECAERMGNEIPGLEQKEEKIHGLTVHRMRVLNSDVSEQIGKPIGNYVTICCGSVERVDFEARRRTAVLVAEELRRMAKELCGKGIGKDFRVLVAGLGNAGLTADALGDVTVRKLTVTGHLAEEDRFFFEALECCEVYAFAPGIKGQTGMDAAGLLTALTKTISADLLVVIDSLAAIGLDHLSSVIQLSDTGIVPGSGVGNHKSAITPETVGIPVISLGIPTVVSSSALVRDVLELAGIEALNDRLRAILENGTRLYVTPSNCDEIVRGASHLLADALNLAFAGRAAEIEGLS